MGRVKTCIGCKVDKPLEAFRERKARRGDGRIRLARCRDCEKAQEKLQRDQSPSRGKVLEYRRQYHRENRETILARNYAWRWERRLKVIRAYGGRCVCCGEDAPEFLVFDHVNGGGTAERARLRNGNAQIALLIQQGYPDTMQILCANCNMAKERPGGCPHQSS
jgi:hypothetical protein